MTVLHPITRKTPFSDEIIEATGLPIGFVIQPFGECDKNPFNDAKYNESIRGTRSNTSSKNSKTIGNNNGNNNQCEPPMPTKAYLIAKCTHCGSPINPTSPKISTWSVLCNICGKTFRIDYETQRGLQATANTNSAYDVNYSNSSNSRHDGHSYYDDGKKNENTREAQYRKRYGRHNVGNQQEFVRHNIEYSLPLFSVSTNSGNTMPSSSSKVEEVFSLPATMCPPLLTIIIDGTSTNPNYYNRISASLHHLLSNSKKDNTMKGSRIGIFIMTKGGGISIFNLKNQGGHIKQLWVHPCTSSSPSIERNFNFKYHTRDDIEDYETSIEDNIVIPLSDVLDVDEIYTSLDTDYSRSCVESALRVIADCTILNQACQRNITSKSESADVNDSFSSTGNNTNGSTYLGSTIQYILEFLEEVAYHPGMYQLPRELINNDTNAGTGDGTGEYHNDNAAMHKFLYAGGKIMCFLAGPPSEIGHVPTSSSHGRIGTGGFGGSCAEIGKRFDRTNNIDNTNKDNDERTETQDTLNQSLNGHDDDIEDIEHGGSASNSKNGKSHSKNTNGKNNKTQGNMNMDTEMEIPTTAFLNIDDYYQTLGMQCAHQALSIEIFGLDHDHDGDVKGGTYFGFPYLRLLSDRSGGNGPLILQLSDDKTKRYGDDDILVKEVTARSTLTRSTAFGSLLRLRSSPCLGIKKNREDDMMYLENKSKRNHKLLEYYCNDGLYGSFSSFPRDSELFFTGSCDTSTTLSFELEIVSSSQTIEDYVYVEDRDRLLKPCVQTCFAYTSVVKINGKWATVRRMRVSTHVLHLSDNTEAITSSLNPEALAINRFHGLYALSFSNDLTLISKAARTWLLNVLLACYKSAEVHYKLKVKKNIEDNNYRNFYEADRLLELQGEFNRKEKLLAQGHEELRLIPLLMFCLIQCDSLRPKSGSFHPSIDARCAAAANMSCMSPSVLSRCIAPRLELWLSGHNGKEKKEAVYENLNMSLENIMNSVMDKVNAGLQNEPPLLLLDSPRQIVVHSCHDFSNLENDSNVNAVHADKDIDIPKELSKAVRKASNSYRVSPPYSYTRTTGEATAAEGQNNYMLRGEEGSMDTNTRSHLLDAFVEDSKLSSGLSYYEWRSEIAEKIQDPLRLS